eukprot:1479641-Rhodomonas_salina.6
MPGTDLGPYIAPYALPRRCPVLTYARPPGVGSEGVAALGEGLRACEKLTLLNLSENAFAADGVRRGVAKCVAGYAGGVRSGPAGSGDGVRSELAWSSTRANRSAASLATH